MDLLLSHSRTHPITGAETWELELGETLKCVGAAFAGVGASVGGAVGRGGEEGWCEGWWCW